MTVLKDIFVLPIRALQISELVWLLWECLFRIPCPYLNLNDHNRWLKCKNKYTGCIIRSEFPRKEQLIKRCILKQISLNRIWYGQKVAKGKFFRFHTSDKNAKSHVIIFLTLRKCGFTQMLESFREKNFRWEKNHLREKHSIIVSTYHYRHIGF